MLSTSRCAVVTKKITELELGFTTEMKKRPFNFFQDIPTALSEELIEKVLSTPAVRIERIISNGQSSPQGFWYDQDEHEWVVVLSGQALIELEGQKECINLVPGDSLHLPAHTKHRIQSTVLLQTTIWLAVFWPSS